MASVKAIEARGFSFRYPESTAGIGPLDWAAVSYTHLPTIPLMIEARLFLENRPRFFRTGGSRWIRSATVVRGARMAPSL